MVGFFLVGCEVYDVTETIITQSIESNIYWSVEFCCSVCLDMSLEVETQLNANLLFVFSG